ncbi:MAG: hypothetical protein ACM3X9_11450 [Bacillota bacterium]
MRKKLLHIGIILSLLFFISGNLWAISVQPMTLEYNAKPGETIDFKVTIKPGDKAGIVKLSLHQATQRLDGATEYIPVDPGTYPPANWVTFPATVRVSPGAESEVAGKIKVPFDAKGTSNMLLMLESDLDKQIVQGLTVMIRYGVALNVRVNRPGIRPAAALTKLDVVKNEKGLPVVQAQIKNTSLLDYRTNAMATIRNSQKKLIQRIELRPRNHWENGAKDPVIYPGSELLYYGNVTEYMAPGEYEVRLFFRFADRGQLLRGTTLSVREGDFIFPKEKMKSFNVSPPELTFEGRPNSISIKAVKFENKSDKPVLVNIESDEIEADYPYSIFTNTKVEIKGELKFTVGPKQTVMKIIAVRFPKDAPVQGNYGNLKIRAYSSDDKPSLIDESLVKLAAVLAGVKKPSLGVASLSGDRSGDTCLVAAVIKNTGNIQITPKASLLLRDKNERVVANIGLSGEGDEKIVVVPDQLVTLTGTIKNLKPGKYQAEIKLADGNTNLGTSELTLEIK